MYKHILVPLDGSELAECVLPHVKALVNSCAQTRVTFLRVVEPVYIPSTVVARLSGTERGDLERLDSLDTHEAISYLGDVARRNAWQGAEVKTEVLTGNTAEEIITYAQNNDVDLVAVATHGRGGISRWVYGSVADRILRASTAPVLMVTPPGCKLPA